MAIWTNWIAPILIMCVFIFLGGGFILLISLGIKKLSPDILWMIKYSMLRVKFNENDVSFLMPLLDSKTEVNKIKNLALLNGATSMSQANEMVYIYKKMLKGGKNHGKEIRKTDGQTKSKQKRKWWNRFTKT